MLGSWGTESPECQASILPVEFYLGFGVQKRNPVENSRKNIAGKRWPACCPWFKVVK